VATEVLHTGRYSDVDGLVRVDGVQVTLIAWLLAGVEVVRTTRSVLVASLSTLGWRRRVWHRPTTIHLAVLVDLPDHQTAFNKQC